MRVRRRRKLDMEMEMEMDNIGSQAQQSGEGLVRGVQHKVGDVIKHATFGYVSPLFYIYCLL